MVVDNADDEQVFFASNPEKTGATAEKDPRPLSRLSDYMPEYSDGSILITTRDKKCGTKLVRAQSLGQSLVEVPKMSDREAQELLHKILGGQFPAEDTSALSIQLEHLPLALVQAAAFVHENSISVKEYLELLDKSDDAFVDQLSEPLEAIGRDSETPHAVTTTWIISFKQIQREHLLASDILSVMSLIDRQAIPGHFITAYCNGRGGKMTKSEVIKASGTLKAFSFVTKAKDDTIDIHRLVHLVTRKWLASQNKFTDFAELAFKTMANVFPYGEHETRAICQEYTSHVETLLSNVNASLQDESSEQSTLLHRIGAYYYYKGYWHEAEMRFKRAVEVRTRLLGEEHDDTLMSALNMGLVLTTLSRLREAEELIQSILDVKARVSGEDYTTMRIMSVLGGVFMDQRRLDEAEQLFLRVLDWCEVQTNDEDRLKLDAMGDQSLVFGLQGRYDEAEELQTWLLETVVRLFGEEHPDALKSMDDLASTQMHLGHWEEAEKLQSRVMVIRKRVLGEEHPDTLLATGKLARIHMDSGRLEEAEDILTQVLETMERVIGEEPSSSLTCVDCLAATYWLQGRVEGAEALYAWLEETYGKTLGREHPNTLASMHNLAMTRRECGRREASTRLMRDCLRGKQSRLGPDHPSTIKTSSYLAEWEEEDRLETGEHRDDRNTVEDTVEGHAADGRPGRRRRREKLLVSMRSLFKRRE